MYLPQHFTFYSHVSWQITFQTSAFNMVPEIFLLKYDIPNYDNNDLILNEKMLLKSLNRVKKIYYWTI